jgi:TorA maturation chaperone TorD
MVLINKLEIANTYKFFSECFYYPDENQLSIIKKYIEQIPDLYKIIIDKDEDITKLQVDYARLFVGPFEVLSPPYGSVYLEEGKKLYGESTMDLVDLYNEENLSIELREPPDHIAIELEFMYYLVSKEIKAINDNNFKLSEAYSHKQKRFLSHHLSKWLDIFAGSVEKHAQCIFYKKLAKGLSSLCREAIIEYNLN